jgi:sulfite reductase alpha subunit
MHFQNEIHRPSFPYKFKIKCSGCPNDCAAASARSDLAIIGLWRDTLEIDQEAVRQYVTAGLNIFDAVIRRCPTWALEWDAEAQQLRVNAEDCVHCMHCINQMPKAIRVGKDKGAALLIGGKAPVVKGAVIGWVLVPFMKMEPPYDQLKELIVRITDFWADNGRSRERVAEMVDRIGLSAFLEGIGVQPCPQMISEPRSNPYLFWRAEEVKKHGQD